ncbi:MAG TPA: SDR family oxidoreductase [Nevskiaceae bacterium]|nr:SDR family oxidoreductase [Nevskiaceae bacterium]
MHAELLSPAAPTRKRRLSSTFEPTGAKPLAGQRALVTGANSGIGAGIARALAEAGAVVAINYVAAPEKTSLLVQEIRDGGGAAIGVQGDVSQEAEVERMFAEVVAQFGSVDIVVNNAGLQRDAMVHELTLADWNTVIGVNLTGQFLCARAAVREFLRRGPQPERSVALGKILNVSSVHDIIPWAGHVNYAASKGGVLMLTKSLAQELAAKKIRVNAISPGAIRTPINTSAWDTPAAEARLLDLIPYGRVGETRDIANAAVWLASDASDYVTGTTIYVDGGMTLYPGFEKGG